MDKIRQAVKLKGRERKRGTLQDKGFSDSPSALTVQLHGNKGTRQPHSMKNNENGEQMIFSIM